MLLESGMGLVHLVEGKTGNFNKGLNVIKMKNWVFDAVFKQYGMNYY